MRKRRVLALLLALSLVVSGNGMTVLAAEQGADMPVLASQEDTQENDDKSEESGDTSGNTEDASKDGDTSGEEKQPSTGETPSEGTENPENPGESEPSAPKEDDAEQGGDQIGSEDDGQSGDQTGSEDDGQSGDQTDTEGGDGKQDEEPGAEQDPVADAQEPTVSENDVEETEEPEEELVEKTAEVRMMSFTDDTGLRIVYDANAVEKYAYTVENGVLTGVKDAETGEAVTFPNEVFLEQPESGEQYTSVAAELFQANTNITYVKLPDGVTSIADNTFKGCSALKGAYLPSTVVSIGAGAFENCTSMTQIAVPKAVTAIGNSAFKGDARLYMVYMKDVDYSALASIGDSAFEGCLALAEFCSDTEFFFPASMTSIGQAAFKGCKSIKKINLDTAQIATIGESAFEECTGLTDAAMSRKAALIPNMAFKGCTKLENVIFSSRGDVEIGESAFEGCYGLRKVELPSTVKKVSSYAFAGCRNLTSVTVKYSAIALGTAPFPAGATNDCLVFVGERFYDKSEQDWTAIYAYYMGLSSEKVAFVDIDGSAENNKQFYKYKVADSEGVIYPDGKLTGGQIWVCKEGKNKFEENINKENGGKGVPSDGSTLYICYKAQDGYSLVPDSVKSNGETLQKDKGSYVLTMPFGGTVITAEFRKTDFADRVEGTTDSDITIEFSNGEPIQPDGVELKIGQTTRMFLLDKSGKPISSSQIQEIVSKDTKVAKVSSTGVITAVGKGTAKIEVTLLSEAGNTFLVRRTIRVVEAEIASIRIGASNYVSSIKITGDKDGIQTAAVEKNYARDGLQITLKANAYTAEKEGIARELTWKSSDTSVARLEKDKTTSADSSNLVTIPKGCEGEATITVSAKVSNTKTVTQKFVVSVRNSNVRLASSSITVNPNMKECGELEVLSSYGADLPSKVPEIIEKRGDKWLTNSDFQLQAKPQGDETDGARRHSIILLNKDLKDGKYNVYVCFNNEDRGNSLPLTINVKRSVPNPTVKFNTNKVKFNLFYKNGGTDKDGNPIAVKTEVTKLGNTKISKFELCGLSDDKADDQLFLENFEIVENAEERAKGIVTIKRKSGNLKYTEKNPKPVVAGYLKIYYEGYRDDAAKKVKVTMPTVTTAPSYVLDRTSVTYRTTAPEQHEELTLLDKKTKQPVSFNENVIARVESDKFIVRGQGELKESKVQFDVVSYPEKDKIKIFLYNPTEWDKDKNGDDRTLSYTFSVNVTDKEPTVKTNQTVTLNLNYPEVEGAFELVSSQKDTVLAGSQNFTYNQNARNADQYKKLDVTYQNGKGTVKIKNKNIEKGTYTWSCNAQENSGASIQKATKLTVKVVDTAPVVKLGKGSLVLNLAAGTRTETGAVTYQETAEIPLKITGKPEGYRLDTNVNTGADSTKIVCKTNYENGAENKFNWTLEDVKTVDGKVVDGKLSVSIKGAPVKKTYAFEMQARYVQQDAGDGTPNVVWTKPLKFNVKVDNNSSISVALSAKGKLNLVDREGEYTNKNSLIYTPTLNNVRGKITGVWIYDAETNAESIYFDSFLNPEDGKIYVTPKKTLSRNDNIGDDSVSDNNVGDGSVSDNNVGDGSVSGNNVADGSQTIKQNAAGNEYQYAKLENNKQYRVKMEVKVDGYTGTRGTHGGIVSNTINIKTAQTLPKVTTDKSTLDVYLSNKQYNATFTVTPQAGAAGIVEEIGFRDDDEVPRDAFEIQYVKQSDGSLKVIVHLKEAVAYKCGSVNKVKMYVKFKGQGTNTDGTQIPMSIRINK